MRGAGQDDFTGEKIDFLGVVIGHAKDVKAMWPEEMGGLTGDENCYLVQRKNSLGQTFHHVVWPEEIIGLKEHVRLKEEK